MELIVEEESGNIDGDEIRKLLNSAARDCVVEERNSVVTFQARTGVEVCTFRLLVNNAASLLDETDPVKMETEIMLDRLIRYFTTISFVCFPFSFFLLIDIKYEIILFKIN